MVVRMMKWRPWPPLLSKKFEVKLVVRRLEGYNDPVHADTDKDHKVAVEIRWKGPKMGLGSFRRTLKRNFTREERLVVEESSSNGTIQWEEEFQTLCTLSGYKDNVFHPWEIGFTVLNGLNPAQKNKVPVMGTTSLNLAEFASSADGKDFELNLPLTVSWSGTEPCGSLCISLSLVELRTTQEPTEPVQRSNAAIASPSRTEEIPPGEKDELSALKAGLRKVKIFTDYVSIRRAKKTSNDDETSEGRSEEGDYTYHFDSDSVEEYEEGEQLDEGKEDSTVRKSFSYGTLAYANYAGGSFYTTTKNNSEDEDWVYYSNRKSDVGCSHKEDPLAVSVSEPYILQNSKRSILPWKKRKLSFRSPKARGEPLLKKAYGEEGGDDIDFDRRQLSSDESLVVGWHKIDEDSSANRSSVSEFGDDNFAVGNWEQRDLLSRDGQMKLQTQVFFASIDQRSERAAGESACTALVAVIADWLQNNRDLMPIKSQFDCLIREGSLEWRNLCENETYRKRFPDKHFDLETVLQANVRSLSVLPGKSFVGFFHPNESDESRFDFLHGAMSFDSMWDEISRESECPSNDEPQVYIVSWNDHFFVLKVESEAFYIIDTLGERLFEGCNQAYILKFDLNTAISKLPSSSSSSTQVVEQKQENQPVEGGGCGEKSALAETEESMKSGAGEEEEVVCRGKECCKEYIKSFLAAIPIRELQADMKKGLMSSTPLHHRLQIEFHYTQLQSEAPALEVTTRVMSPVVPTQADVASVTEVAT